MLQLICIELLRETCFLLCKVHSIDIFKEKSSDNTYIRIGFAQIKENDNKGIDVIANSIRELKNKIARKALFQQNLSSYSKLDIFT